MISQIAQQLIPAIAWPLHALSRQQSLPPHCYRLILLESCAFVDAKSTRAAADQILFAPFW